MLNGSEIMKSWRAALIVTAIALIACIAFPVGAFLIAETLIGKSDPLGEVIIGLLMSAITFIFLIIFWIWFLVVKFRS